MVNISYEIYTNAVNASPSITHTDTHSFLSHAIIFPPVFSGPDVTVK
jgi:hypothetical protein